MRRTWGDYWKEVCAPKLKRKKELLGRAVPEREIAAAVESATGKSSERGLVSLWLLGEREPYISQFFALCQKLDLDPFDVLRDEELAGRQPLARSIRERVVRKRTARERSRK